MVTRTVRTPAQALTMSGISSRAAIARIVATYQQATPEQLSDGIGWYDDALCLALELADASGLTVDACAAVIAHLSPKCNWDLNKRAARALVLEDRREPGVMIANYNRARAAMCSADPIATFGPSAHKTRSFTRNILGDVDAVTVDVWAWRVALPGRTDIDTVLKRAGVYDGLVGCYQSAARKLGVDARTVQAVTWCVARGKAN
jgi:hypothetical protein